MDFKTLSAAAAAFMLLSTLPQASAQEPNAPQNFAQPQIPCDAFVHNPNGSWSPTRRVTINGTSMSPGAVSFNRGVKFGGVDVADLLDTNCQ
jgi:hypothetical protein